MTTWNRDDFDENGYLPEEVLTWVEDGRPAPPPRVVAAWLAESPLHGELLHVWEIERTPAPPSGLWNGVKERMDIPAIGSAGKIRHTGRVAPVRRTNWLSPLRAAALVVLGLGLGLLWPQLRDTFTPQQYAKVIVPAGSQSTLELPGGVRVQVNYDSELSYVPSPDVREVYLEGEAYFSVPEGAERNLLVHTEAGLVRDLGTEFNVWARSGNTSVAVTDGTVRLETPRGEVALEAGEESSMTVGQAPAPPSPVRLDAVLDWTTGQLTFYDEPLARVAQELERRYGVPFEVDTALQAKRITGKITAGIDAAEATAMICSLVQASCHEEGDGWLMSTR